MENLVEAGEVVTLGLQVKLPELELPMPAVFAPCTHHEYVLPEVTAPVYEISAY